VGCQHFTFAEWDVQFDAVANKHGATEVERLLARHMLEAAKKLQQS
jgi:hypothetical protein